MVLSVDHSLSSLSLCAHLGRQEPPIKDNNGGDTVMEQHPHAMHGIIDISRTDLPVSQSMS